MNECPSCGAAIEVGATACSSCGAPLGARREAIERFAGPTLITSPWLFLIYVPVMFMAGFVVTGGWMLLGFLAVPGYVLAALFMGAAVAHFVMELIAIALKAMGRLTLLHHLAVCSLLSFGFGFLPSRLGDQLRGLSGMLLEDYADSLLRYAILLYVLAGVWWSVYWLSGGTRK